MEQSQENHAEYLLRITLEACEDHRDFAQVCARFNSDCDMFRVWLDDSHRIWGAGKR